MKEAGQILDLWRTVEQARQPAVLATVVKTRGSAYRLPGARLLLTRDGQRAGSVSGGCLEDDLVKKAWWLTESGPVIRRYDTTPEGEIGADFGLGCNGVIDVLIERLIPGGPPNVLRVLNEVRRDRRPAAIAHVIKPSTSAGQRLVIDADGKVASHVRDSAAKSIEQAARAALSEISSRHIQIDDFELFVETLTPTVRLLIFGAGDDAVPLTDLAKFLGWTVSVIDGRAHYARRVKFPNADQVSIRPPGTPLTGSIDPWTVGVVMTHSYSQDLDILRALAANPPRYLGLLGPLKRSTQLLVDAGLDAAQLEPALHSPIGLDIGADGPHQVALAIIAEIQAVLNGRRGGELRSRRGSIHAPDEPVESEGSWLRSIVCA